MSAVDKEQLCYSIQSMYGQGMNAVGYLQRFIDLDFDLPVPDGNRFCDAQFARFGLEEFFKKRTNDQIENDRENIAAVLITFFKGFNLSLTEQEHCFCMSKPCSTQHQGNVSNFSVSVEHADNNKNRNHQLYFDFVAHRTGYEEIIKYIGSTPTGKNS